MSFALASLRCNLVNAAGFRDELGEAKLTEEALILEGHQLPGELGIPWEDLAHILNHPFVQQRLNEVEMMKEAKIV